jgi:HD-GYP domain-containing protein (c-di-GMP phosphodiesterase class II)
MLSTIAAQGEVRLAELIAALSLAVDLSVGQSMEHALRSCLLAVRLGEALGLADEELADAYYLALLRYVGCTAEKHVEAAVFGDEIAARTWRAGLDLGQPDQVFAAIHRHVGAGEPPSRRARRVATALAGLPRVMANIPAHCEVGQRLAGQLGLGLGVQDALTQIYERWDGRGRPRGLKGEEIARPLRIVLLAHQAVIFHRLGGIEAAVSMARERAGGLHDPKIVECFCRHAPRLMVPQGQELDWDTVLAAEPGPHRALANAQLDVALEAIADFADLQVPCFAGHSRAVGRLAGAAASRCGLPAADVVAVGRAGLLHDVGRVGVSAGFWGKAGRLSIGEWERVRLHAYYAERVLARPRALAHLGTLAGLHHERLDGSGYHRGVPAALLSPAARILAAADVYHAMTEPRPHRPARSPEQAADELRREVRLGRLDGEAAHAVLEAREAKPRGGRRVRSPLRGPRRREWPAGLSEREVEVLRLAARGHSNRQMARRLFISERTVAHHIQHMYDKMGVSTRAGATLFAMQHDLLRTAS